MSIIRDISARQILDSSGHWTIEVTMIDENKNIGTTSVPQGESAGEREAVSLPAERAVDTIYEKLRPELLGREVDDQRLLDRFLIDLDGSANKHVLGGNAILGVSLAHAKLLAQGQERELWQLLREVYPDAAGGRVPRLYMNLIEGGVHAGSELAFQEYLAIPEVDTIPEAVAAGITLYARLKEYFRDRDPRALNLGFEGGLTPALSEDYEPLAVFRECANAGDTKFTFGLDVAGSNVERPADELTETYKALAAEYPIRYIEDPYHEEDIAHHAELTGLLGESVLIAGDDLTVTNTERMREINAAGAANAMIIKPNQIGTVTEAMDAVTLAREFNWQVVCSHRGSETTDDWIADIAYAVGADGIKLGAPARGERVAKYNRLLEISNGQ